MKKGTSQAQTCKLSSEQQMEVCKRFAWFWTITEIEDWMKREFGIVLSRTGLRRNYKDSEYWKPVIDKFREDYLKSVTEVPLANKRKRLEELQKLFDRAISKSDDKSAVAIIKEFRDEMERKVADVSFNFTQITHNEFHDMTDEDLQREKVKTLEQLEKVRRLKLITGEKNGVGIEDIQEIEEIKKESE